MSHTQSYSDRLAAMRRYFQAGNTKSYAFRKDQLKRLKEAIISHEKEIFEALYKDLKKSAEEAYSTEVGLVLAEISLAVKKLKKWMRPKRIKTNLLNLPSSSRIYREPYGVALIIGSWNYPFQLLINPLVGAIAAGNCAVLKPSESALATSAIILKLISETFSPDYIAVYEGEGHIVVPALMDSFRFDYIFYTGSTGVGKIIYEAAAKSLTPVTLELGGKSPAIVEEGADIKTAARRIAMGKFLNAGQTCIAPDYVLVHDTIKNDLINEVKKATQQFFGQDASASSDYSRIIHEKHFDSLVSLLPSAEKIIYGGQYVRENLFIEPTIVTDIRRDAPVMEGEIFGPILPVLSYNKKEEALDIINGYDRPLSFYLFTNNTNNEKWWLKNVSFGNGCINNTLWQFSNPNLPFGGVGGSGIGAYHGKYTFETFSHAKSIMKTPTWLDPSIKYPPFKGKLKLLKMFIR